MNRISNLTVSGVLLIFLAAGIPAATYGAPARSTVPAQAVIVVGKAGDNLWPLNVSISADGLVTGFYTRSVQNTPVRIKKVVSRHAVAALLSLTRAERLNSLPKQIGTGPANAAARSVTFRDSGRTFTVVARGRTGNAEFLRMYYIVLAVAGVPCSVPRRCDVIAQHDAG